jgi:two-component system, chemotaxis family, sensor kinase Cph1
VECEPGLMRMVLQNLVGNAVKYRRTETALRLELAEVQREGERGFEVRDNGIGFENKYAAKLFEPFERLHRNEDYPGTGIGLANVKRIVERHGGRVWASGEPGVGSTFGFTLP